MTDEDNLRLHTKFKTLIWPKIYRKPKKKCARHSCFLWVGGLKLPHTYARHQYQHYTIALSTSVKHEQTTLFPTLRHSPCTHRSTQDCDGVVVDGVVIVVVVFVDVVSFADLAGILHLLVQVINKLVR